MTATLVLPLFSFLDMPLFLWFITAILVFYTHIWITAPLSLTAMLIYMTLYQSFSVDDISYLDSFLFSLMVHNLFVPMVHRVFFNTWPSLSRYCFLFAGVSLNKLLSLEDDHHHEEHKVPQAPLYGPFSAALEHTSNLGLYADHINPKFVGRIGKQVNII